MRGKWLACLAW